MTTPPFAVRPAARVGDAQPYKVPRAGAPIDLHLDGNEGAKPPASLLDAPALRYPAALRRYPKPAELEVRLADQHGVDPAQIIVTAGGDDAIDRLCKAVLEPGRRALLPLPGFEMIGRYAELAGATVEAVDWPEGPWPLEAVLARLGDDVGLVAMVSPNNPTGQVASAEQLQALSAALPHGVVLLDHAYVEFAEHDLTALALSLPNVVVVRTFSKAWGLAGLRVGYAIGPAPVIGWLRVCGAPYAVSHPSLLMVQSRLGLPDEAAFIQSVAAERAGLTELLRGLGAKVAAGQQANFVFARVRDPLWIRDGLAALGIGIRAWPGRAGLADAVRITCPGHPRDFDRLTHALQTALAPQALLFDMDGVLADVRASYRQAIIQACAAFGVAVDHPDIEAVKAAGDANNDWIVSQRLLAARGVEVPLEAVTEAFEAAYQGGLWRNERLLVDRAWLAALADRIPLAVVTGRPRGDADRFLQQHDLTDLFSAAVCMEDAARKPDPAPVRLALARLGLTRAWMLGDTPDDVRAARAAGVIALGVVAPGEAADAVIPSLIGAGAARVLAALTDLEALLP
ncbi:MAG: aminotransferase class I/II-fold pyridoxal phosphate-dependent enzyme [Myxococcales bacterium]|nr:aminotransferase class I/II-fold pyridoxal phosphate-dependent enzyme [Myxococcales bacterium]MCB9525155.1 aminotransferase class I/II-fold pyridoxal phosphate-dependent enzyme [Myxococcales bacterium]